MVDDDKIYRVLELYSGIGGMHYALKMSKLNGEVVAAVDINPHANTVYKYNFKASKTLQKTIEGIKLDEYERLNFNMILMSPPCQPFTRQGNQNGSNDNRAKSFLSLIDLIPKLSKKPKFILMENVKGFDQDEARAQFIQMLKANNYTFQEFLLSPIQFGIPNSRLRYFLIAKLDGPFCFNASPDTILTTLPSGVNINDLFELDSLKFDLNQIASQLNKEKDSNIEEKSNQIEAPLTAIIRKTQINESYTNCSQAESANLLVNNVRKLSEFVVNEIGNNMDLYLNKESFQKSANSIDVVTINSTRSSCFTKNYGRFVEGTGSILKIQSETNSLSKTDDYDDDERNAVVNYDNMRYFTPKEIANLHCFPDEFEFPVSLTTIQKWRLIGNSLNVLIVSVLIKLMTK